jgi:hypothetical protein
VLICRLSSVPETERRPWTLSWVGMPVTGAGRWVALLDEEPAVSLLFTPAIGMYAL